MLLVAHNNPTAGPWACLVLHAGRFDPFAQYTPVLLSHDAHVATALISVGMFLGVHVHSFHCFALVHVAQAAQRLPGADSSSYRPPCSRTRLVRLYLNVVQSNRATNLILFIASLLYRFVDLILTGAAFLKVACGPPVLVSLPSLHFIRRGPP